MVDARRVLARFLAAKPKGVSLLPDYKDALTKLQQGDPEPALAFAKRLAEIILPGGERPEWFAALSVQKMNAIKSLYNEAMSLANKGDVLRAARGNAGLDPARWVQGMAFDMAQWAKDVRTLEIASAIADAESEIPHGPFTVIPIPGLTSKQIQGALAALDEATSKIHPKFPQVLYGKVYLSKHLKNGVAAWYEEATDSLALNVAAKKRFSDVFTIIHELGHRHDKKFLSTGPRSKYWNLSTRKVFETIQFDAELRDQMAAEVVALTKAKAAGQPGPPMSDMLVMWLKSPWPHQKGDIRKLTSDYLAGKVAEKELAAAVKGKQDETLSTGKVLHGPLSVTPYGATKPAENYAEGFAHFCLGMDMPPELAGIIAGES